MIQSNRLVQFRITDIAGYFNYTLDFCRINKPLFILTRATNNDMEMINLLDFGQDFKRVISHYLSR